MLILELADSFQVLQPRIRHNRIPPDVQTLVLRAIKTGTLSDTSIAATYNLKRSTVYSVRKIWETSGRETALPRGGRRSEKMTNNQKEAVLNWVDADCTSTNRQLVKRTENVFEIRVSESTVSRLLKDFHYSVKRVSLVPERRNSAEVIEAHFHFAVRMVSLETRRDDMFYLDEVGFQFTMRSLYGRSPAGTRANVRVPQIRSRNFSCAAAMSTRGLSYFKLQDRPYNTGSFVTFIVDLIQHLHEQGIEHAILVADNVSFHHSREIQQLVHAHEHELIFIAPYSPFLNPIEETFNQWKSIVRNSAPRNPEELVQSVNLAASRITSEHCQNYIRHSESYRSRCLLREVIEN